jgi:hypothetical protein
MSNDPTDIGDHSRRWRAWLLRPCSVAAAMLGLAILGAACSSGPAGPGVANVDATRTSAASSPSSPPKSGPLAFSQCMRAHGVTDFPDPSSDGRISIHSGPGSGLDPNNPTMKEAMQACQSLQPKPSAAEQHQFQQAALRYAQCMRAHGIKDFPDPTNGGLQLKAGPGSDLDPNSPAFQAAQNACQHFLPGSNGGGRISTQGGGGGSGISTSGGSAGK